MEKLRTGRLSLYSHIYRCIHTQGTEKISTSHPSSKRLFPPLQPLEEFAFSARKLK